MKRWLNGDKCGKSPAPSSSRMMESLETRRFLSGNVVVTPTATGFDLVGDDQSNEVVITFDAGAYLIAGANGTTVNGQPFAIFPTLLPFATFNVSTGQGDDVVTLAGNESGSINVNTGQGDDTVNVALSTVLGNLSVNTGLGDDSVLLGQVLVGGNISINTGRGDDAVGALGVLSSGNVAADGGDGEDLLVALGVIAGSSSLSGFEIVIA